MRLGHSDAAAAVASAAAVVSRAWRLAIVRG